MDYEWEDNNVDVADGNRYTADNRKEDGKELIVEKPDQVLGDNAGNDTSRSYNITKQVGH